MAKINEENAGPSKHFLAFSTDYGPLFLTMVQYCSIYTTFVGDDSWVLYIQNGTKMSAVDNIF